MVAQVHPDCINSSNPYHECSDYCFRKIAERKTSTGGDAQRPQGDAYADLPKEFGRQPQWKKRKEAASGSGAAAAIEEEDDEEEAAAERPPVNVFARPIIDYEDDDAPPATSTRGAGDAAAGSRPVDVGDAEASGREGSGAGADADGVASGNEGPTYETMSERQKKLFDLRLKLNQARKQNQTAVVAEKRREQRAEEEPTQSRGVSKAQWFEQKQKRMSKVLDANGLDMSRAYMLDTQEAAEHKYEKREKKEAAFGWDVFNSKSLYKAYKKRAGAVPVDMDEYQRQRESDPDFYRDSACLEYGKAPALPAENVDRMVAELTERGSKRKEFSRRRRFHEEKDVDSISERNEHFNRKIERAFGKYTAEIKNNLERGTALPD